jgi:thiamine-phosphate pyrophosphorylase
MIKDHLKLCLITNAQSTPFSLYKKFIMQTITGGITLVQLREKSKNLIQLQQMALELKSLLNPFKIPLIINDHIEITKETDVDGVHLGQSDLSPIEARQILGPKKIIGWSVETLEELEIANQLTCIDYIAASTVFPSQTKSNCKTIWGLEGLQKITSQSKHPVVAIGGIYQHNIQSVIENGACGAAVISAIHQHSNPRRAASNLLTVINQSIERRNYA